MNIDFDENKPEEAVSDYPEELETGEEAEVCPSCKSENVKVFNFEGDDHKIHTEIECRDCGCTQTN